MTGAPAGDRHADFPKKKGRNSSLAPAMAADGKTLAKAHSWRKRVWSRSNRTTWSSTFRRHSRRTRWRTMGTQRLGEHPPLAD
jgi:hypothetical protein